VNPQEALQVIVNKIKEYTPNIVATGPDFNAGRYGTACAEIGSRLWRI